MTRARRIGVATLAAGLALAAPAPAAAETLRVTTTAEEGPGSLGETILEAGAGDVIELPPGRYLLTNGETLVEQGNTLEDMRPGTVTIEPSGGGEALEDPAVSIAETIEITPPRNPTEAVEDAAPGIAAKAQVIALIATAAIFLLVLELVRRRRLVERYALLWMSAAVALLVLAIWTDGLEVIADAMGIEEPANAIFILAFGVGFVLLLHFSVATSRLGEETQILAQEVARLDLELRRERGEAPSGNGGSVVAAEDAEHERPVGAQDRG